MSKEQADRRESPEDRSRSGHARIIDMDASLKRLGHDRQLQSDLVVIFFEDSEQYLEKVITSWKLHQSAELKQTAHCLKGLCANFDAHAAVEAAFAVEVIGAEENWDDAAEEIERLEREIARLRDALGRWQQQS